MMAAGIDMSFPERFPVRNDWAPSSKDEGLPYPTPSTNSIPLHKRSGEGFYRDGRTQKRGKYMGGGTCGPLIGQWSGGGQGE